MSMASRSGSGAATARRKAGEFHVGDRILTVTGSNRGVVRYVGEVKLSTGTYVGVELDEPKGETDGTKSGVRYFECKPKHATFLKPSVIRLDAAATAAAAAAAGPVKPRVASGIKKPASTASSSSIPSKDELESEAVDGESAVDDENLAADAEVEAAAASAPISVNVSHAASPSMSPVPGQSPTAASAAVTTFALPSLESIRAASPAPPAAAIPTATVAIPAPSSQSAAPVAAVSLSLPAITATSSVPTTSISTSSSADAQRLQALQASYDALQVSHNLALESVKKSQEESRRHADDMRKLSAETASLQSALQHATKARNELEEETRRLTQDVSNRDRQLAELKTELSESSNSSSSIESLQSMVEMLTLDKELAEEQVENTKSDLSNLQSKYTNQELELQILRDQHAALQLQSAQQQAAHQASIQSGGLLTAENMPSTATNEANQKLLDQNALLTDALRKLRDVTLVEKQNFTSRIAELEKSNQSLVNADKDNFALRAELEKAKESVQSLKEQLDEALELQSMCESLSASKLDLEESLKERDRSIAHLKSLVESSEELEDGYKDLQAQLQTELENKEFQLVDLNQRYKLKTTQIDDLQTTNRKFRELVRTLENDNHTLKLNQSSHGSAPNADDSKQQLLVSEGGLAATRSSSLLAQRLKQVRVAHVEKLLSEMEVHLMEKKVQFLQLYFPANISIDDRSLLFLQLLNRIKEKSNILAQTWAEFYGNASTLTSTGGAQDSNKAKVAVDYSSNGSNPELALLSFNACLLLSSVVHSIENLTSVLYTLDIETYNSLCIRSQSELTPLENILDSYLDMMEMDTLNELTSLQSLQQANWILYSFLIEKVPTHAFLIRDSSSKEEGKWEPTQEFNVLPYQMALWTVLKRSNNETESGRWQELAAVYRSRVAAAKRPAGLASGSLCPSSVPSLPTFARTLQYCGALCQTYSQLISDQLNGLVEKMRKARNAKQLASQQEKLKKERQEALGSALAAEEGISVISPSSTNASLSDYNATADDADIALYTDLWSELADAVLNQFSLASQFSTSTVTNYMTSLNSLPLSNADEIARQEKSEKTLLPHLRAIDSLAQHAALELANLFQSIRGLINSADVVSDIASHIQEQPADRDSQPYHPALRQLKELLLATKTYKTPESPSLFATLTSLRTELFTSSKKVLQWVDENMSRSAGVNQADAENPTAQAQRSLHQRNTSLVLTASEVSLNAPSSAGASDVATAQVVSTLQPWFHHPVTIRTQLSASASLRVGLQEVSGKLSEKTKEVFVLTRQISEEKAKQDVLNQQLAFHSAKANAQSEYASLNESLKIQLEESNKQINLKQMELDKLSTENRAVRKQMLKQKAQYLKDEQTRTAMNAAAAKNTALLSASGSMAGGLGGGSLTSQQAQEFLVEIDSLRDTLRVQREELASWKARESLREFNQVLPPLPAPEAIVRPASAFAVKPLVMHKALNNSLVAVKNHISHQLPSSSAVVAAASAAASNSANASAFASRALLLHRASLFSRVQPLSFSSASATTTVTASMSNVKLIAAFDESRNGMLTALPPPNTATASESSSEGELRFLRGQVSALSTKVLQHRMQPRVIAIPVPGRNNTEDDERKQKEAAESDAKSPSATAFSQYLSHRVDGAHLQQYCAKLSARVEHVADHQKLRLWTQPI